MRQKAFRPIAAAGAIALAVAQTQTATASVAVAPLRPEAAPSAPQGAIPVCKDYDGDTSSSRSSSSGNGNSGQNPATGQSGSGQSGSGQFGSGQFGSGPGGILGVGASAAFNAGDAMVLMVGCNDTWSFGGPGANEDRTADVVDALAAATQFCSWLPPGVRIDCLADRLRQIARALPRGGDYAPVREALRDAARELSGIARANAVPGVAPKRYGVRPPGGGAVIESGPLAEVAPDRRAAANAAALAVLQRTETVLLRSTENSRARMVAYQEIATALDSTKVLLRST